MTLKIEKFSNGYIEITGPMGCGKTTEAIRMQGEITRSGATCLIVERECDISSGVITNKRPTLIIWDSIDPPDEEFRKMVTK
jgi:thymidine kinase